MPASVESRLREPKSSGVAWATYTVIIHTIRSAELLLKSRYSSSSKDWRGA
jgi:hypothetical protein